MGTRGLTVVVKDGKHRVAQYGQWDHYPKGQGVTALTFCAEHLSTPEGREKFAKKVDKCRFIDDAEFKRMWRSVGADLDKNGGMVPCNISDDFSEKYPALHRDAGAKVLSLVHKGFRKLQDELEFASGEGGFFGCEGVYVVDLDNAVLEVHYCGKLDPLGSGALARLLNGKRAAVPLMARFDLGSLPDDLDPYDTMERLQAMILRTAYPDEGDPDNKVVASVAGHTPEEVAQMAMGSVLDRVVAKVVAK